MNETASETPAYADWLGRTTQLDDVITAAPVKAMSAALDRDDPPPAAGQVRARPVDRDAAKHASLWARGPQGQLAMQASATLA